MRNVLLEAVLVGAAGVGLALLSNAWSPRGLKLTRNYFPSGPMANARALRDPAATGPGATGGTNSERGLVEAKLQAEGLQFADAEQAARFFGDPKRAQELVVFVDARDDDHYQAGHIPGAYQLDHYHPEKYLSTVLPACQSAETIVVYCKGGSCEDSEQTALFLRDSGISKNNLYVYTGGFDEWNLRKQPIELGQRNSGQMQEAAPASGTLTKGAP